MARQKINLEFSEFLDTLTFDDKCHHKAEVLLLSCIDFRFFNLVQKYIDDRGLSDKFDHVILAGAELGAVVDFPPEPKLHWQQFFLEHLALSKQLHCIDRLVVLGHRNCGAYEKFKLLPENPDRDEERRVHAAQAERLQALVGRFYPGLPVEVGLLTREKPADVDLLMLERLL